MAVKTKTKSKAPAKSVKKPSKPLSSSRKSATHRSLGKAAARTKTLTTGHKPIRHVTKESPSTASLSQKSAGASASHGRIPLVNPAIQVYEAGLKAMHSEEYEKAVKAFKEILLNYPSEPEIQERARMLMQAAEKKAHEKRRQNVKSADDHYNIGIAELNSRRLESAIQHFQSALDLTPKSEHILYAMAAAHAVQRNRDQAVSFFKQSLLYRPENRFLAARDTDFESLRTDSEFLQLLAGPEKEP